MEFQFSLKKYKVETIWISSDVPGQERITVCCSFSHMYFNLVALTPGLHGYCMKNKNSLCSSAEWSSLKSRLSEIVSPFFKALSIQDNVQFTIFISILLFLFLCLLNEEPTTP